MGVQYNPISKNVTVFGYLPVVPMVLGSIFMMVLFSFLTKPPSAETLSKYFEKV